jgi:sulfatase modifying factor 1
MTRHCRAAALVAVTLLEGCSVVVRPNRGDLGSASDGGTNQSFDPGAEDNPPITHETDGGNQPTLPSRGDGGASLRDGSVPPFRQAEDGGPDAAATQEDASLEGGSAPPPAPLCPEVAGMKMAHIQTPLGAYCIDVNEVTQRQYWAFLDAAPDLPSLYRSKGCAGVSDVSAPWRAGKEDHPVSGVSYCGAEAYCSFVGKSLCGDISSGGTLDESLMGNALHDMWSRACSGESHRAYPYGDEYEPEYCNGDDNQGDTTPVRSLPHCATSDQGIFDLSGNVWEWTNTCNQDVHTGDYCLARGGSYDSDEEELSCSFNMLWAPRIQVEDDLGFRCCSR